MSITKSAKSELIQQYKTTERDNGGSAASQVAVLTARIRNLTEHMKNNHKDLHSRRGLTQMVNRRKSKSPQKTVGVHQKEQCFGIRGFN